MPRARSKVIKTIAHWEVVLKPAGPMKRYMPDVGEMFEYYNSYYERLPDPAMSSHINGYSFTEDANMGLFRELGSYDRLTILYGPFIATPMEAHVIKVKESKKCEPKKRSSSAQAPSVVPAPQDTPDWSVEALSANPVVRLGEDERVPVTFRINYMGSVTATHTREEQETDEDQ